MAQGANLDKAHSLYKRLKRRPLSDKSRIIQNLKDTSNVKAAAIIEETEITREATVSSSSLANGRSSKEDISEVGARKLFEQ